MDFYAVLDHAVDLLRQRGRVTYRALKIQFKLDDDQLETLKDELLYAHPQVVDDAGRGLLWTGTPAAAPPPAAAPALAQDRAPLSYTPPHLAEQILTSRAALEGERKQVTVLFADLKGSMELLAERDPEEARHLLDPVLDRMMAAVHQYEGTVNQVLGDGIMALFGAPLAHEDHAVRAGYAALRMQEAVKPYATEVQRSHGVPIHMRVGLNAGEVVVRSRLQAAAARGLTRFVGRQPELETLQQALAQAQAGHGQVMALVGEAGVGKSRLLYEFCRSHHTQGWLVLESASVSYGKATPYFPVVDLLKRYCHVEARDAPRTIRAKVTGQLLTLDEALQATIPAVLALLDALPADSPFLTVDPPQRRQRTLDALKRLLLRESQVQPLLLVCEDLHWIDTETQAFLHSLIESLPTAQFLLLVNYRPEYQHGWGSKTYYRQLRLDPLPAASADAFLQMLLGDDPSLEPLTRLLIGRTGGNPEADLHRGLAHLQAAEFLYETRLFPEREFTFKHALTHEVVSNGLLQERRRGLHTRIVEALEALYPDRLVEQVERLAHHAMRGEAWDKALAYNRQAGVRVAARSAYREAVAYFEQALAALEHLPEHRATLAQAIDVRLDLRNVLFPLDEHARIFDHLRAAEALAERLDDPQRFGWIASYLCISFSALSEHDRAIAAGQHALALATSSGVFDVQVVALTDLGGASYFAGDFRQALDALRRVMALLTGEWRATRFGQPVMPAVISRGHAAGSLAALGDFAEGRSVAEDAVRLAEAAEQPFSIASALWYAGLVYRSQGALHTAIPMLERSLALYETANIPMWRALTASILGAAYALAGRAAEALPLLDEVLERVATGRPMFCHALVLTELSEACLLVGRVDEVSVLAGRLLELSRAYTGSGYQAYACWLLGEVARRRDPPDIDQATAHYRQALALAEELGMRPLQAHCHLGLGTLYAQTGQRQQAQAVLSAAIDLYRAMDMTFWLPQAEAALAQMQGR
jgi:tetratricopeptide (TPR) repeat protein